MTSMTQHPMGRHSHQASQAHGLSAGIQDLNKQCLRILRCTAEALANSPGGLRFKAGTRPWLEGLSNGPALMAGLGRRGKAAVSLATGD